MKYFNKTKKLLLVSIVMLSLFACEEALEEVPTSDITEVNFFRNNDDLRQSLIAAYDRLQPTYRQNQFLWGEFRSDNYTLNNDGRADNSFVEIAENALSSGNTSARWASIYRLIANANIVISNAENISDLDETILGEALALRSKAYFDAVRVWGDLPVFTEPFDGVEPGRTRTAVAEIYDQIIVPDMVRALELVNEQQSEFFFSKSSILAHQAEVYMWLAEQGTETQASDALSSADIALTELKSLNPLSNLAQGPQEWDDLFHNDQRNNEEARGKIQTGRELIMSIPYSVDEDRNFGSGGNGNRAGIGGLYTGGIILFVIDTIVDRKWRDRFPVTEDEWVARFGDVQPGIAQPARLVDSDGNAILDENGDEIIVGAPVYGDYRYHLTREDRGQGFDPENIYPDNRPVQTHKWSGYNGGNEDDTNIVLYRLSDMVLLEAELRVKQGNSDEALVLMNQIRSARQLPLIESTEFLPLSQDDQLDFVLDERQFELFAEGKRWWDLRRNNKVVEVVQPILDANPASSVQLIPGSDGNLLWPIFQEHLVENSELKQNTFYN